MLSSALRSGARNSVASSLGILAANSVYFLVSATGLGAVLMASSNLFFAVKWIGAAYLIFLGLQAMLGRSSAWAATDSTPPDRAARRLFVDGFVMKASNPNTIVFFSALLPQFIDPRRAVAPQVGFLGVTSVVIEFFVLLGYGLAAGKASTVAREPRYAIWTNRVAGTLLIGAGAGLAALRRN